MVKLVVQLVDKLKNFHSHFLSILQFSNDFYNLTTELAMILVTVYYLAIKLAAVLATVLAGSTKNVDENLEEDYSLKIIF